jgi:tetratricopeptide (TPR) repeat protein
MRGRVQHGFVSMPTVLRVVLALTAAAIVWPRIAAATPSASDLAAQAMQECDLGQDASARDTRKQHFERGESLASQAVALDERSAVAHFALVCNLGELLRLDGEKITSLLALRRLMSEVNRTLELDPDHVDAMATKGNLLLRLPRLLGGDPKEGERLLREVVKRDDNAVTSRITLAKACVERGDRDEAVQFASRALQVARQQGRSDKIAEAEATLEQLGAGAR